MLQPLATLRVFAIVAGTFDVAISDCIITRFRELVQQRLLPKGKTTVGIIRRRHKVSTVDEWFAERQSSYYYVSLTVRNKRQTYAIRVTVL